MYHDTTFPPPGSGRLAQFMRLVEAFERDEMEAGVDLLIQALDQRDGDPDLEPNGDELDASWPIDGGSRRDAMRGGSGHEDAEDDDPDEIDGDERDGRGSEEEFMRHSPCGPGCPIGDPPALDFPSDGEDLRPVSDPTAYQAAIRRIRATRCDRIVSPYRWPGSIPAVTYRLRDRTA